MYYLLRTLSLLNDMYGNRFVLGVMEKKVLYDRADKTDIPVVCFGKKYKYSVKTIFNIIKFIKRENITHVHTHGPRANVFMNVIRKYISVKWIVSVHSNPVMDFMNLRWRHCLYTNLHLRSIKNADIVISVCSRFHPTLLENGVNKTNLTTIHNGIDFTNDLKTDNEGDESNRNQLGFSTNDFLFVQVARLENVKGHIYALRAMKYLIEKGHKHIHLLLIGNGSLLSELKMKCKTLHIDKHVHFFGEQLHVDMYYQIADVTLLTSLSESFPFVLLESALYQKPLIATNVGDINQLIVNKELGWLVKPQNVIELAEAMEQAILFRVKGKLESMGEKFYHFASANFSLQNSTAQLYKLYEQC